MSDKWADGWAFGLVCGAGFATVFASIMRGPPWAFLIGTLIPLLLRLSRVAG